MFIYIYDIFSVPVVGLTVSTAGEWIPAALCVGIRQHLLSVSVAAAGSPVTTWVCSEYVSINQRSSQSHTRAEEKPHPSTTTGGANPASQSDAGLGGYMNESRQH